MAQRGVLVFAAVPTRTSAGGSGSGNGIGGSVLWPACVLAVESPGRLRVEIICNGGGTGPTAVVTAETVQLLCLATLQRAATPACSPTLLLAIHQCCFGRSCVCPHLQCCLVFGAMSDLASHLQLCHGVQEDAVMIEQATNQFRSAALDHMRATAGHTASASAPAPQLLAAAAAATAASADTMALAALSAAACDQESARARSSAGLEAMLAAASAIEADDEIEADDHADDGSSDRSIRCSLAAAAAAAAAATTTTTTTITTATATATAARKTKPAPVPPLAAVALKSKVSHSCRVDDEGDDTAAVAAAAATLTRMSPPNHAKHAARVSNESWLLWSKLQQSPESIKQQQRLLQQQKGSPFDSPRPKAAAGPLRLSHLTAATGAGYGSSSSNAGSCHSSPRRPGNLAPAAPRHIGKDGMPTCLICGKTFRALPALFGHMRVHGGAGHKRKPDELSSSSKRPSQMHAPVAHRGQAEDEGEEGEEENEIRDYMLAAAGRLPVSSWVTVQGAGAQDRSLHSPPRVDQPLLMSHMAVHSSALHQSGAFSNASTPPRPYRPQMVRPGPLPGQSSHPLSPESMRDLQNSGHNASHLSDSDVGYESQASTPSTAKALAVRRAGMTYTPAVIRFPSPDAGVSTPLSRLR
jgi:hypothetical protein